MSVLNKLIALLLKDSYLLDSLIKILGVKYRQVVYFNQICLPDIASIL